MLAFMFDVVIRTKVLCMHSGTPIVCYQVVVPVTSSPQPALHVHVELRFRNSVIHRQSRASTINPASRTPTNLCRPEMVHARVKVQGYGANDRERCEQEL
jgi:hypothetical protein